MATVDHEIESLHVAWAAAIGGGHVDAALALLCADYVLWAAGAEEVKGREAVRPMLTAALATYVIEPTFTSEERIISGDLAVERGWDEQTLRPRAEGEAKVIRRRVTLILRREPDGRWRYARGMSQPGPT